jgi:hypothetical protein
MLRMQLPQLMYRSDAILSKPKDDDDVMMGMRDQALVKNIKKFRNPGSRFFQSKILWEEYIKNFNETPDNEIYTTIRSLILQRVTPVNENDMLRYIDESNREKRIQSVTIRLMGTPEYQLC